MIIGAHSVIYSKSPEADRAFLRDVLGFPHVDVGGGWLIFALPPSEVAVHPADGSFTSNNFTMDDEKFCGNERTMRRSYCHPDAYGGLPDVLYHN